MDNPRITSLLAAALVALVVALVVALAVYAARHRPRETFVSARAAEVHRQSLDLFALKGGGATHADFRAAVPGADAVLYSDARALWRSNRLTPERVERIL